MESFSPLNTTSAVLASAVAFMSTAQRKAWASVLNALRGGKIVSFVMIGGSMARGQGCTQEPNETDACAYAARVAAHLRESYPQARILFENRAVGGMTTGGALLSLPTLSLPVSAEDSDDSASASMLLIDYAINDNFEPQSLWTNQRKREDLGTYQQLKTHLKRFDLGEQVHRSVAAATEAMLRYILEHRPQTAVMIVEGTCWRSQTRRTHEAHRRVARYYGVPSFDFIDSLRLDIAPQSTLWTKLPPGNDVCRACIRPKKQCEHSSFPTLFSDGKHPDGRGHQLVADALVALLTSWWRNDELLRTAREQQRRAFSATELLDGVANSTARASRASGVLLSRRAVSLALPPPFTDRELLAQHTVCASPTTLHAAASPSPHPNVTIESGWRWYEDRPGKPGWISTGPNGSAIEFGVQFGLAPRLTLMWTLGYEGFARAAVSFNSERNRHRVKLIDGLRTDGLHATQAAVLDMDVGHMYHGSRLDLAYGVSGWSIKPRSSERFRVEMLCRGEGERCGKFKILAVRAC